MGADVKAQALIVPLTDSLINLPFSDTRNNNMKRADGPSRAATSNKGVAWSEAEHLGFLNGLKAFGRGQWKQISHYYVPTRTPTQVASHAQKHFLRVAGGTKRRSRFSSLEEASLPPFKPTPGPSPTAPPEEQSQGASAASDAAMSTVSGVTVRVGAPLGALPSGSASFSLPSTAVPFTMPPPPDANGMAVGIPVPKPQTMINAPNGQLPMLPVQPGRLNLYKMGSESPSHTHSRVGSKPRLHLRRSNSAARRAQLEQLRETVKPTRVSHRNRNKGSDFSFSHSGSVCSDTTSAPHTAALDALAGVAAALADSAGSLL